jgi:ABC-type dipeptide/oligopeptide/nickel transport system permease subunit
MAIKADTQIKRRSMFGEVVFRLLRNRTAMSGLIILIVVVLLCICAGIICPEGYNFQNIEDRFQLPNKKYLLGTDELGRSLLARVLYGGRLSLLIGVVSTLISAALGVVLGAIAAYFGSLVDDVMMRILDIFSSIPSLLMAIAISATLGSNIFNCMLAVGISSVPSFARMVRGPVLAIMHQEYIEAAHKRWGIKNSD